MGGYLVRIYTLLLTLTKTGSWRYVISFLRTRIFKILPPGENKPNP